MQSFGKRFVPLFVTVALVATSCALFEDIPRLTEADLANKLAQSSVIYADDGSVITTLHGEENRTVIRSAKKIPKFVTDAVVSIEDERFYEHEGVDLRAIVRAAVTNLSSGEIEEGGSTITQQYVKNVIIAPGGVAEKTLKRKIDEAALARQLEKILTKDQILKKYLNTVYFGRGAYGIQAAAKTFFGTPAPDLTLRESATLAGLIRAPTQYDPVENPDVSLARRDLVLTKMAQLGHITQTQMLKAQAKPLKLHQGGATNRYPAPYFVDYVQRLLTYDPRFKVIGKTIEDRTNALFRGGLRIHTTLDSNAQAAAERAVAQILTERGDPYGSMVAMDPKTGYVRAMVGGRDWFAKRKQDRYAKLNLAVLAEPNLGRVAVSGKKNKFENVAPGTGRQAGSAFKPFALAAAIKDGVSLSKVYKAQSCMDFPGENAGGNWHVCNYESQDFGKKLSLLEATVRSVNVVYAQLILEIGPQSVAEVAKAMGINTNILPVPSAVLGSNPVNPLGMTTAYATLANNGVRRSPIAIKKIEDSTGKVIYKDETEPVKALEPAVAYLTTTALQQVVQRGTGVGAQIGRPQAGKTGTAQEYRDAWFGGYTPDLAAAVWVGYPEGEIEMKPSCSGVNPCRPTRRLVTGGSWPAQIWQAFMLRALSGVVARNFNSPNIGLVSVTIDTRTGCLAGRFTPPDERASATFAAGTEPEETCRVKGDSKKIPDVFGFPVEDAVRILRDAGFKIELVERGSTTYPPGRVIGQAPAGGQRAPKGSSVRLEVSVKSKGGGDPDGETEIPSVLGYTKSAAEATLKDAGFKVKVITESESNKGQAKRRSGRVWKQSPGGGSSAKKGSTVTIWVNPE